MAKEEIAKDQQESTTGEFQQNNIATLMRELC